MASSAVERGRRLVRIQPGGGDVEHEAEEGGAQEQRGEDGEVEGRVDELTT